MVVKGIIQTIDYNGNTCTVRMPLFEGAAASSEVIIQAIFANQPGIYNGYKEGDVVFVAFENGHIDEPIIIGKLYLGAVEESKDPRGAINANNIKASTPISIPLDTKLILDNDSKNLSDVNVDNGLAKYKTIADIAKGLQKQSTELGSLNTKIIDDGENWGAEIQRLTEENVAQTSRINQNAEEIVAEVSRASEAEGELDSKLDLTAEAITAEVNKKVPTESGLVERGLSWVLKTERWEIDANDTIDPDTGLPATTLPLMTLDRSGMVIYGNLVLAGYPKTTEIKFARNQNSNEHPADSEFTHDTTEGLYEDGYYIWKRSREVFYEYNTTTEQWELTKYANVKYECITGAAGATGEPATTYWTKISTRVHTGKNQEANIEVTPYAKTGGEGERVDTTAYFKYSLDNGTTWSNSDTWTLITTQTNNKIVIAKANLLAENVIIKFAHQYTDPGTHQTSYEEYENETITYSPLNTPIIDLDNDTDAIKYNPDGTIATGSSSVSASAQVYLGGSEEAATYTWSCTSGTATYTTSADGKTITVSGVSSAKAILTCTATTTNFKDENGNAVVITKDFTVSREVVVASYWLSFAPVHTGNLQQTAIEIKALAKIGNDAEGPDGNAYLRYSWDNGSTWTSWAKPTDAILVIATSAIQNANLRVQATHVNVGANRQTYEDEIITYSPLNTPILDLSNDSASIPYNVNTKIGSDNVTSTARVYLNGQALASTDYTLNWTAVDNSCTISQSGNTVTVSALAVNTAIARCTVTNISGYAGTTLTKDFIIAKALKGDGGKDATSYWLDVSSDIHTGLLQTTNIIIYAYKQTGYDGAVEEDTTATLTATAGTFTKSATGHLTITATEINGSDHNPATPITANITVIANRDSTDYDTEIIEYSADTPIISLSNDAGQVKQDKSGTITGTTTQPKLYVKGQQITSGITFSWGVLPEGASQTASGQLIVNDISSSLYTFTCSVSYNGTTYTKDFIVSKVYDGTDGLKGNDGYSTTTVMLYTRSLTTVANNPVSQTLYYKFDTKKLYTNSACTTEYTLPNGWSYTIDGAGAASAGNLYCIAAIAYANSGSDEIPVSEWAGPTLYVQNGKPNIKLSIENDFDSVTCTYEGTPTYNSAKWASETNHTLKVYEGSEQKNFNVVASLPASPSGFNVVYQDNGLVAKTGTRTASNVSSYSWNITGFATNSSTGNEYDKGNITYTLYKDSDPVGVEKFTAEKLCAGSPGEAAPDYNIIFSTGAFKVPKTGNKTPQAITVEFKKSLGDSEPVAYAGKYKIYKDGTLYYPANDTAFNSLTPASTITLASHDATGSQIDVSSAAAHVDVELYAEFSDPEHQGQTYWKKVESETIDIVDDGTDGTSIAQLTLYQRASSAPGNPTADGTWTYTITASSDSLTCNGSTDWTRDIPSGTDPCYESHAAVFITGLGSTTISNWSAPAKFVENGTPGVGISETKQWYILWPENATDTPDLPDGSSPEEYTEIEWGDADYPSSSSDWQAGGRYVYYQGNYIEITSENYAYYDAIAGFDGGWTPYRKNSEATRTWYDHPLEPVNGYVMWTSLETIFDDNTAANPHYEFSNPVKDAAYALAQGKSTNYYSANNPATDHSVKKGDCWFVTPEGTTNGYVAGGKPGQTKARDYIGNYYKVGDNYYKITNATSSSTGVLTLTYAINGVEQTPVTFNGYSNWPEQYKTNVMLEWDGSNWKDVDGEQITNKLTANYINALNITAKRIEIKNENNTDTLFLADGITPLAELEQQGHKSRVEIAGWHVNETSLFNDPNTNTNTIQPGDIDKSLWFSTGTSSSQSIGGSRSDISDWVLTAGTKFGLDASGNIYTADATINANIFKATSNLSDSTKNYPDTLVSRLSQATTAEKEVEIKSGGALPKKSNISLKIDVGASAVGSPDFGYYDGGSGNGPIEELAGGRHDGFWIAVTLEQPAQTDLKIPLTIVAGGTFGVNYGSNIPVITPEYIFNYTNTVPVKQEFIVSTDTTSDSSISGYYCWSDNDLGKTCNIDLIIKKDKQCAIIFVGTFDSSLSHFIGICTLRGSSIYYKKEASTQWNTTPAAVTDGEGWGTWEPLPGWSDDIGGRFSCNIPIQAIPDLLVTGNILPDYTWIPIEEQQSEGDKLTIIKSYQQKVLAANSIGDNNVPWTYGYFNYLQGDECVKTSNIETIWTATNTKPQIGSKEHPFDKIYVRNIYYLNLNPCDPHNVSEPSFGDDQIASYEYEQKAQPTELGLHWEYDFSATTSEEQPFSDGILGGSSINNAKDIDAGYQKLAVSVESDTPVYSYYKYGPVKKQTGKKNVITVSIVNNGTWMRGAAKFSALAPTTPPTIANGWSLISEGTSYKYTCAENENGYIWVVLGGIKQNNWALPKRDISINIYQHFINATGDGSGGSSGGGGGTGTKPPVGGGCFEAGTKVTMADGSSKNIEDIQSGEEILSYNIATKILEPKKVLNAYEIKQRINLVRLYFSDGTVLDTTINHPFYTTEGWVSLMPNYDYDDTYEDLQNQLVEMMQVGQRFYILSNNEVKVVRLTKIKYRHGYKEGHCVYNLKIEDFNTFFTNGILGHNAKDKLTIMQLN